MKAYFEGLVDKFDVIRNIKNVKETINLSKISDETYGNISEKTLETAAKMFTYLNYCPPKRFITFFEDLFNTASARNMTFAMLSVMKTSKNADQRASTRIFQNTLWEGFIQKKKL